MRTIAAMRLLLLGWFAAIAAAQSSVLFFTRVPNPITDGQQQVILWSTNDTESDVTLRLLQGSSGSYETIYTITDSGHGGQYVWKPPKWIPNGDNYRLEIRQKGQRNYFGPLNIQGASASAITSHIIASSRSASIERSRSFSASR